MNFFNKFNNLKNKNLKTNITKILSITTFGLLFIIMGSSYAYLTSSTSSTLINTLSSGNLELKLDNETSTLSLNKALPQLDDDALESNSEYTFTLSNTGDVLTHYEIYLNNVCSTSDSYIVNGSTITPDLCVDEKYINIGIKEETGDYTIVNFENNKAILDIGEIWPNEEKNYIVKIWLDIDTPNEYNSYLNGVERNIFFVSKINITGEQREYRDKETPEYCFNTSGSSITGYNCYEGNTLGYETITDVVIPSTINEVTIIEIGSDAFYSKGLTSIDIPDTVTYLDAGAFAGNNLKVLKIPSSITKISTDGLANPPFNNTTIEKVIFKDNWTVIPNSLFMKATLSSEFTIPYGVTSIGDRAFYGAHLTSVTIPNSVTIIENNAFIFNHLTTITIPESVTTIEGSAFLYNSLTSVKIKGKSSSSDFILYGSSIWGWADGYSDSNIEWNYTE